jgi:hypothetical protein
MKANFQMWVFLAKLIHEIPGSQIKTKCVFNLVGVLTTLKHYHLQVENMDRIITVVKNWPNDPCHNCKPNANLKEYFKKEDYLAKETYDLLEEVDFFKQLHIYKY